MPIIKRLVNPTKKEVNHIADLLMRAYADDPTVLIYLGGDASLLIEFQRAFIRASCLEGETYVVIDEATNEIATMASWFPPGRQVFDSAAQRALGFDEVFAKLSKETRYWHQVTHPAESKKIEEEFFTKEELARRWWCFGLATDPKHQRKGYATAAILDFRQKLKDMDPRISTGLAAWQEGNIKFYEKVDFKLIVHRILTPPPGTEDDVSVWVMCHNKPARKL